MLYIKQYKHPVLAPFSLAAHHDQLVNNVSERCLSMRDGIAVTEGMLYLRVRIRSFQSRFNIVASRDDFVLCRVVFRNATWKGLAAFFVSRVADDVQ